ncbi:hypothetical protein COCNU_07G013160 [Cocos nucifera]|uniref:Uncharacterized protein n=1 Tax=Cocos nucifera TaxID=13894 RepID=A0A8K0N5X6_COCNU|nr:hypothetical protein COCNU_07G013160 [Cocos nucifera]
MPAILSPVPSLSMMSNAVEPAMKMANDLGEINPMLKMMHEELATLQKECQMRKRKGSSLGETSTRVKPFISSPTSLAPPITADLEVGYFLSIIIESATNHKADVTKIEKDIEAAKAEASNHKAKIECLKEVKKKKKATESEATEVRKEEKKKVAEVKHLAVKEFKSSKKFTMIRCNLLGKLLMLALRFAGRRS